MRETTAACWRCAATREREPAPLAPPARAAERVGRRDACLACGADLRCCRNCAHFSPASSNQCREPQAERQVDKERGNFCDWFSPGAAPVAAAAADPAAAAKAKLDALFRRSKG